MKKEVTQIQENGKIGPSLNFVAHEAYSLLRTNLAFSFPDHPGGKIVGVTSSHPQEGKSYTSINLAYSLAEDGKKVVFVDADVRKSRMKETLQLESKYGVSDYLAHTVKDVENIMIHGVMNENLTVLLAGNVPPNPAELIGSERMRDMLKQLAETYEYVIVDLPPVLDVSDAVIVTKYLDGIMVVVRGGVTRRSELRETIRRLQFSKVRIVGFVYNSHSDTKQGYYKKGYGYSSYGSKNSYENSSSKNHVKNDKNKTSKKV